MPRTFRNGRIIRDRVSTKPASAFYPKGDETALAQRLVRESLTHTRAMKGAGRTINPAYIPLTVQKVLANAAVEAERVSKATGREVSVLDVLRTNWSQVRRGKTGIDRNRIAKRQYD